ncbi:phosphonate ABC transporter ATP-binding protein [Arenibacter certesii]|uniref:Cell division ATP-binding protein FtsE n=2 Tax=Arenibacter certesii TaxID=228955 RepID=A0A918IXF6_9FLAO|nr:phosphonate ABC transporter ATP-binding protein [Arenibacter certesii]
MSTFITMGESILKLKDVAVFQAENLVLNDISLEIKKGEFVYLIGKTGSGKSSFMKMLYGDLPLKQGDGTIVDFDLKTLRERDIPYLRRKLGVVFQDFKLLPDRNINNNLLFVLKATGWKDKSKMDAKIEEVLGKVDMKTKGFKFPHELSGGEQQRIAIARALLNDPELILADEPTGNLDPQTSVEVMKVLQDINKTGRTILMATHDYALILKYPSKTLKCDGNKVFEVIQRAV